MRKAVFGQAVTAIDVEHLRADTGPIDFVRLCGALIGQALVESAGSFALPQISERINVPDGGIDAEYTTPNNLSMPETGGLIGPGRTVFQFKYRDPASAARPEIIRRIIQRLRDDFGRASPACDRYVFMTNVQLTGSQARRLHDAIIKSSPAFMGKPIIIWGAAEIALALNTTPHLRHLLFLQGGLCTLDFAEAELKAGYRRTGWPSLINREQELAAIDAFVRDETARVLQVQGPKYVGKTRLVIEALRSHGPSVLWATSPEDATLDLFRDLDSSESQSILVIDRCDEMTSGKVLEWAQERRRLKTIIIRSGTSLHDSSRERGSFFVEPLSDEDARKLLATVVPRVLFGQQSWAVEAAGGLPGLVLHIGDFIREARISVSTSPGEIQRQLGSLLEEQYLSTLAPQARQALEVASLLPVLGIEGEVGREVEAVCRARGLSPNTFETHLQALDSKGLVRRRGRFVEVVPPKLAEHLASRALTRPKGILAELEIALAAEPGVFLRFLERFRNLSNEEVKSAVAEIFSVWFPDLQSLMRNAKRLEILAPAAPTAALRCIQRLLEGSPADELKSQVTGDARRALVWALEDLALRSETFTGAATQLLALAEAENETWGNNATGVFLSLFHWQHPEVTVSLSHRLRILQEGATSGSALRRKIIAAACGETFKGHRGFTLHHPKGPVFPERPYRPETWEEVRTYALGVFSVLASLLQDADPDVKQTAISAIIDNSRPFINISLTREGFHELGRHTLETIETIGRAAQSARLRTAVVSELELTLDALSKAEHADTRPAHKEASESVKRLLEQLTSESFRDRLWRWIGPKSWSLDATIDDDAGVLKSIQGLAHELSADPRLFERHIDWLTSEEAQQRPHLFQMLGKEDKGSPLFPILLRQADKPLWPQAFGYYMRGWFESEPDNVESEIDKLVETKALIWGVLTATCWLPPSAETVDRLLRLAGTDSMPKPDFVNEVARLAQWDQFSADEAERLLKALDDKTPDVRSLLLFPFLLRILLGAELTSSLKELAWSFLASTFPVRGGKGILSWDSLAAKLGKQDPERLLSLIESVEKEYIQDQRAPLDDQLPLVWGMLKAQDRQGLLRMLLRLEMDPNASHWIGWQLSQMIEPSKDHGVLLDFCREAGVEGARLVTLNLDADKPGFWELARDLLHEWGDDHRVKDRLVIPVMSGSSSGSAVQMISARIEKAKALSNDSGPRVAAWAQEVLSSLEEWRTREEREDREQWIWDYRIRRSELEAMLTKRDSPERLWAIGRLLEDAPKERVLELLTPAEILEALPNIRHLDEPTRQKWEGWARHWSESH